MDDEEGRGFLIEAAVRAVVGVPISFWLMDYGQKIFMEDFSCPPDMLCNVIPVDPVFTFAAFAVMLLTLPDWRHAFKAYFQLEENDGGAC